MGAIQGYILAYKSLVFSKKYPIISVDIKAIFRIGCTIIVDQEALISFM